MAVVRVKMGNQVVGKWVQLAGGSKQQLGDLASLNVHCNASKSAMHFTIVAINSANQWLLLCYFLPFQHTGL